MTTYRWNMTDFATGYDAAAEIVHPRYVEIQDEMLRLLSLGEDASMTVLDLGGGSGKLMERILERFPNAQGVVVDQSEAFLALAERRLARFGDRAKCVLAKLQNEWADQLSLNVRAIVSMSAIHHLEPAEKSALYQRCFDLLAPGGVLLNGDEVRPQNDADYLAALTKWAGHMRQEIARGVIPESFRGAPEAWIERNVTKFGQPKKSGDDCHERIEAQLGYFRAAGFAVADCPWHGDLWAILRGIKS
jgi:cyclopropane fatty-acyl-phospholipid synthase-like methyltransferase